MSDFIAPSQTLVARKQYACTYCAEPINHGEAYTYQSANYDGRWSASRMHHECFQDLCESGDGEYTPYSNERPKAEATAP